MNENLELERWIGRERVTRDTVSETRARALAATLDRGERDLSPGADLPPGWHWIFCNPAAPHARIGVDGHEERPGGFLPPIPESRRMWAGGVLRFQQPLRIGEPVERTSTIAAIQPKRGRTGPLVFVNVLHRFRGQEGGALDEEQQLVYRLPPRGGPSPGAGASGIGQADPERTPERDAWSEKCVADEVTLFRFSALTFNAHRIHYDFRYATEVEGYPGLVVHGPLLALLLLEAGLRHAAAGAPVRYSYRAVGPLYCGEEFLLAGSGPVRPPEETAAAASTGAETGPMRLRALHPERGVATRATLDWTG